MEGDSNIFSQVLSGVQKKQGSFGKLGQVSAWQSATLLPISCKSVQPVPARVEEPVSLVKLSQDALSQHGKVGCENRQFTTSAYFAVGGEHD